MQIHLSKIQTPICTPKAIDHIWKNHESYNAPPPNDPRVVEIRKRVYAGQRIEKYPAHVRFEHCEIIVDDQLAGEVSATMEEGEDWEISIMVFEQFGQKGIGKKAVNLFLTDFEPRPLKAVVQSESGSRLFASKLFQSCGFREEFARTPDEEDVFKIWLAPPFEAKA